MYEDRVSAVLDFKARDPAFPSLPFPSLPVDY